MKRIGTALVVMLIAREWSQFVAGVVLCTHGVDYAEVEQGVNAAMEVYPSIKWYGKTDLMLIRAGYAVRKSVGDI